MPQSLPHRLLAACVLSLVVCPLPFVFFGSRDLNANFYGLALPPYAGAAIFLALRYLARPSERPSGRRWLVMLEAASWLIVGALLFMVSGIGLAVGLERLGAASEVFLGATVVCLPVVLLRSTTLAQRLARLPKPAAMFLLLLVMAGAAVATVVRLTSSPRFPGA